MDIKDYDGCKYLTQSCWWKTDVGKKTYWKHIKKCKKK